MEMINKYLHILPLSMFRCTVKFPPNAKLTPELLNMVQITIMNLNILLLESGLFLQCPSLEILLINSWLLRIQWGTSITWTMTNTFTVVLDDPTKHSSRILGPSNFEYSLSVVH